MNQERHISRNPSDLQIRIDEIAHIKTLEENKIGHAHALAKELDPTLDKAIAKEIIEDEIEIENENQSKGKSTREEFEFTIVNENKILTKRKSRGFAGKNT